MLWIKLVLLSFKDVWRNKTAYLLFSFELVLVGIMAMTLFGKLAGTMLSKDLCYAFEGKNMYYLAKYEFIQKEFSEMIDADLLQNIEIISLPVYSISDGQEEISAYGYNDLLLSLCKYKMTQGIWFDEYQGNHIPVISLDERYRVGDQITIKENIPMEVIGYMNQNAYLLNFHASSSDGEGSLDQFVSHPDYQLIVPRQNKQFASIEHEIEVVGGEGNHMIFLQNNSDRERLLKQCKEYGTISSYSEMRQNYEAMNQYDYTVNGIVLLIFILVSTTGIIGYHEIRLEMNRQRILVYQLNGAKTLYFIFMEVVKNLVLLIISYLLFYLAYRVLGLGRILKEGLALINFHTFVGTLLFLGVIILLSSLGAYRRLLKMHWIAAYKRKE